VLAKASVLLVGTRALVDTSLLDLMGSCQAIIRYGIGVDNIDVLAAIKRDKLVVRVEDYCIDEVADHAVAMLLYFARGLGAGQDAVQGGHWGVSKLGPVRRFNQTTVGIVGLGAIGRAVANRVSGFGASIIAYDPFIAQRHSNQAAEVVKLAELLERSDFVSLHCPLTSGTKQLINAETLGMMKKTAFLINTSRGGLVDEAALSHALDCGVIAGAALDVLAHEPPGPGQCLVGHPRVLLTPHSAWYSKEAASELRNKAAQAALDVLSGKRPTGIVNAGVGGGMC